ncbi:Gfa-like protein [Candidatus Rhodobacter oscarellae]|uniref:Gfa-like protein n=1 Tax=Candidatus Rhodobacter oscarellae TaxID=1675527 RepID=A0A0J9ED97_9RHOB|nr:GFA family protein [Candidatus Rhodobacter lobularis]KMW59699.1 Gfa-like protein [Candidatus Rhodobacter lobularis]
MKAHCLCGAVEFDAEIASDKIQACHCKQCQRWTGGGPLVIALVKNVTVSGADHIASFRASEWGERAFCKTCGSTLYWKMQGGGITDLPVGLFEDQSGFTMGEEIFVDHRPDWLPHWEAAGQSTEAQEQEKLRAYREARE